METPTKATASPLGYTYTATDAGMSTYSLNFHIEVNSPVSTEQEAVPESFTVYSNYPNPFQRTTRLLFDLPWPAQVVVEVMDVTGRRMFQVPTVFLTAGREKSVDLNGESLPSGLYLYRMIVTSPESTVTHVGSPCTCFGKICNKGLSNFWINAESLINFWTRKSFPRSTFLLMMIQVTQRTALLLPDSTMPRM